MATLLIFLATIVVLGLCWFELLSRPAFGGSVLSQFTYMWIPRQTSIKTSCGGRSAVNVLSMLAEANDAQWRFAASPSGHVNMALAPVVVIDLCAALQSPRLRLEAALNVLNDAGVEVAIYSALPAWNTRAALRGAAMLEWFDHIWHIDAIRAFEREDYAVLASAEVLNTPERLDVKTLMRAGGIPPGRVPAWLRWLV